MSDFKIVSLLNPVQIVNQTGAGVGVSAGLSSQSSGTVTFGSSAGNVTFGLSNGYMTASAPAGGGGGGTNYVFSNSNGVTFGTNVSTVTASVVTNYMASNQSSNFVNTSQSSLFQQTSATSAITSNAMNTSVSSGFAGTGFTSTTTAGTAVVATQGTNGLSMGVPAYLTTYAAQTNQTVASGNIAGVGTTFAGTNISGSLTLNSVGLNVALSVAAGGGAGDGYNSAQFTNSTANSTMPLVWAGNSNGSGNVTIGLTGSTITMSAPSGGGAGDGGNIIAAGGSTAASTGTIIFSNANNVSFSLNGSTITASASFNQTVDTNKAGVGYTSTTQAGTTVGATHNTAGLSMAWPPFITTYAAQTTQTQAAGNLAGTGYTSTTQAGSTVGVTQNTAGLSMAWPPYITTFAQSVQTQASGNIVGSGFTSTTTAGSAPVATLNSNGLSMGVPQWITTFAAQSVQTQASGNLAGIGYTSTTQAGTTVGATHNTAGLSMAWPPYITTYVAQTNQTVASGNIAGIGTTFGGTNISGSMTLNSVGLALSLSAAAPGGGGAINVAAGTTNGNLQTISFVDGGGVSFGLNGSTITASAAGGGGGGYSQFFFQPEVYGNTLTSTLANGTVYFRPFEPSGPTDADRMMFQQSLITLSSTRSLSGAVSGVINTGGTGSWGMTATMGLYSRVDTNETGASYMSIKTFASETISLGAGYTLSQSQSTNVSSATVSYSSTFGVSFINKIDGTGGFTTTALTTTGSGSFSSTSTGAGTFGSSRTFSDINNNLSGIRPLFFPMDGTVLPAGEYWVGINQSTASGSTGSYSLNAVAQMSTPAQLFFTASTNNYLEIGNSVAMTTSNWRPGFGSHSASSATTGNVALSQISNMVSNASLYFAIQGWTK